MCRGSGSRVRRADKITPLRWALQKEHLAGVLTSSIILLLFLELLLF